jgi:hypothetical protein
MSRFHSCTITPLTIVNIHLKALVKKYWQEKYFKNANIYYQCVLFLKSKNCYIYKLCYLIYVLKT